MGINNRRKMDIGFAEIEDVTFGLNSGKQNEDYSFAKITNPNAYESNGMPYKNGIYDLRLGTTEYNQICHTCLKNKNLCDGHRGSVTLKTSVLQPIAIPEIRQWLRIICLNCGRLMMSKEKIEKIPIKRRLNEASIGSEGKLCPCGAIHPKIKKDKEDRFTFWITYQDSADDEFIENTNKSKSKKLYPDTIKHIFQKVTTESVEIIGKPIHPKNLTINCIEVPPNTIRPGIKNFNGEGSSSLHDSTTLLQHIIKRNNFIPEKLPECVTDINSKEDLSVVDKDLDKSLSTLQQLYYDLIIGSDSTSPIQGDKGKRGLVIGSRPVKSILRNLPRKEGRIRANLLGKRSFFTSRTTISGNVSYKIDEVGIPIEFAKVLQVEEYVQECNIEWLTTLFLNGRTQYPGCTHVIRKSTGEMHDVSKLTNSCLEIGDILYRDVINGDYAYFNRMPTLQRSSLCVHKVIVIKDPSIHTFQMNVLACELYNADFDGDQMHVWIARGINQRVEASIMSSMHNWFISTKTSGTVNGQVQDSIIGCYEITRSNIIMDKYHAMSLFSQLSLPIKFNNYPTDKKFTGREIMSMLLSFTPINYKAVPKTYNDLYKQYIKYDKDETFVDIENGIMKSGVFESSIIGTGKIGGLFHLINREYNSKAALDVIYAMQQIALQFLMWKGFTVGTGDIIMNEESIEQTSASVSAVLLESELITKRLLEGKIIPPIGSTVYEFYESLQREALQLNTSEIFRWITKSIDTDSNNFFKMIFCGSKGGTPQLISIMSAIGRTIVNGKRIQELFSFRRTSPYCARFSTDAKSYGFVANSYVSGMTSTEFIFQDMNSRFDLINKALSTATTGYFMKKGIMNNQSSITDNYRRVVKGNKIVQFIYGEDGLDARNLESVKYPLVFMSDSELIKFSTPNNLNGLNEEVKNWQKLLIQDRDEYRRIYNAIESTHLKQNFTDKVIVSVNVKRLIENVKNKKDISPTPLSLEKINKIKYLYENLAYCLINDIQEAKKTPIPIHKKRASELLCLLIRAELNPRVLETLTESQVDHIVRHIRLKYSNSLIDYGTAVGILAVQSISEPITQYMLDSHHRSVGTGTSKAGMVRISEIYGTCPIEKEQTPSMILHINDNLIKDNKSNPASIAQEIANSIEFLSFKQFVKNIAILLEPYSNLIHPNYKSDKIWMDEFIINHPLSKIPLELTNWCFRFVIDKSNLVLKSVDLQLIVQKIKSKHPNTFIIFTPEASPEIIIRLWNKPSQKRGTNIDDIYNELLSSILDTPIRGIPRIMNASVEKHIKYVIGPDNSFIKQDNHVIITHGTNLYNILLNSDIFNIAKIASNSIPDTFNIYGIEAARTKIINETKIIVADSYVNIRHLYLYADERTRTGRVTSFERGGLAAREHNNVLLRAGYHDPIRCLIEASLNNTKSNIYGIAACQLLGTIPKIGSVFNSVIIDEQFVKENVVSIEDVINEM